MLAEAGDETASQLLSIVVFRRDADVEDGDEHTESSSAVNLSPWRR